MRELRTSVVRFAAGGLAYAIGYFATLFVFVMFNGIEGEGDPAVYFSVFGLGLGFLLARTWVIAFPALHLLLYDYVWMQLKNELPVYWEGSDPFESFLVLSTTMLVGVVARVRLTDRLAEGRAPPGETHG